MPPSDLAVTLDVEPRKPRLAWQGMDRKAMAAAVPTQVNKVRRGSSEEGDDDVEERQLAKVPPEMRVLRVRPRILKSVAARRGSPPPR